MIYVSSACVKNKYINESIIELAEEGYQNIELSGGTMDYDNLLPDLLELKIKYNLNYLCHNYFPPPKTDFVVNLASLDKETYNLSFNHLSNAIILSEKLGASKFGFHAGFLINIFIEQIGKSIAQNQLFDKATSIDKFQKSVNKLSTNNEISLYVENNVISAQNLANYKNINPLLLCDSEGFKELNYKTNIGLILDVAHLKVSCKSLNLDFENELLYLFQKSDYIHISDNDGLSDSNQTFKTNSDLFKRLNTLNFSNKITTLEIYTGLEGLKESYQSVLELYKNQ